MPGPLVKANQTFKQVVSASEMGTLFNKLSFSFLVASNDGQTSLAGVPAVGVLHGVAGELPHSDAVRGEGARHKRYLLRQDHQALGGRENNKDHIHLFKQEQLMSIY